MAIPGRVTAAELTQLLVEVDEDAVLSEYIDPANELVTEVCAPVTKVVAGVTVLWYTTSRLKLIEKWLAAHFYCILDAQSKRDRVGPITFESQNKVDLCLDQTRWGQQAKVMDTAGGLSRLDEIAKGNVKIAIAIGRVLWLGTRRCELPISEVL